MFKLIKKSKISRARLGLINTAGLRLETPFFAPDATRGVLKGLSPAELKELGLKCLVTNTLHLFLRPGVKLIRRAGGIKTFMDWPGAVMTDSGGYQIFSLIHKNRGKITDQGAIFHSPLNGAKISLTPEQSIKIQLELRSDLVVCLDDCPPNDFDETKLKIAVERTIKWAKRCRREFDKGLKALKEKKYRPLLIAVIQGGDNAELRRLCAEELIKIGFDGYGFGARHVDEAGNFLERTLSRTAELIPENNLRFGLGIGAPEDILRAVKMGWDAFDCVIPTREGRHGRLFFWKKTAKNNFTGDAKNFKTFYQTVNITNAKFAADFSPLNPLSRLKDLKTCSKAYLHYLFKLNDPLAGRLASLNNLEFYLKILSETRELIKRGKF